MEISEPIKEEFFKLTPLKIVLTILLLVYNILLSFEIIHMQSLIAYVGIIPTLVSLDIIAHFLDLPLPLMVSIPTIVIVTILWNYFISCIIAWVIRGVVSLINNYKKFMIPVVILLSIGIIYYGFANLGSSNVFVPTADDTGATPEGVALITKANNQFAINLYKQITYKTSDNIFFSPWSISYAMVIAYEGARGETANEIKRVFHFPINPQVRRSSYARMINVLNKNNGKYQLSMANSIWIQKDYPILDTYKDVLKRYYISEVSPINFNNGVKASDKINHWVSKHTNNKIKNIVSPGMFDEYSRIVIANAIYFKGKWVHKFDREDTRLGIFKLNSGKKIKVLMMHLRNSKIDFRYTEQDSIQILEMPYQGGRISMLVLLPKENNIQYLESILSERKIQEWRKNLKPTHVYITFPKFKFEKEYPMSSYLKNMGVKLPFKWPGANFSGIDGTDDLYIKDVIHKAYIDVYEEGTEAAATTVWTGSTGAALPPHVDFIADHPFIFILQEKETGNILFIGRVMKPEGY